MQPDALKKDLSLETDIREENKNPSDVHRVLFQLGEVLESMIAKCIPGMNVGDARVQRTLGSKMLNAIYLVRKGTHAGFYSGDSIPPAIVKDQQFLKDCLGDIKSLQGIGKNGGLVQLLANKITKI